VIFGVLETSNFAYHRLWFRSESISTLRSPIRTRPKFSFLIFFSRVLPRRSGSCYSFNWIEYWILASHQEPLTMEWTTPQHEEIDLNCEISSYANAEL